MIQKTFLSLIAFLLFSHVSVIAQNNPPEFSLPEEDTLHVETGQNIIQIPDVDDGDNGLQQNVIIEGTSSNPAGLKIDSIVYTQGEHVAFMYVQTFDTAGTFTIDYKCYDDGTNSDTIVNSGDIVVKYFDNSGVHFIDSDYDFWRPMPYGKHIQPHVGYDLILSNTSTSVLNPYWSKMWGYIVPPETNKYVFTVGNDKGTYFYLSSNKEKENIPLLVNFTAAYADSKIKPPGVSGSIPSDSILLEEGKIYYFEAYHRSAWGSKQFYIEWSSPTIAQQNIPEANLIANLNTDIPDAPLNVSLIDSGVNHATLHWQSPDDYNIVGYHVYVNGKQNNATIITDTIFEISGLSADSVYSLTVRSADEYNNLSVPSHTINVATYADDNTAPAAPTGIIKIDSTGTSVKLAWDKAQDAQTSIIGYNVYRSGLTEKANTLYIRDTSYWLTGLDPESAYDCWVTAVDAGKNESDSSAAFSFVSSKYNPLANQDGSHRGRLNVFSEPLSNSPGLGVVVPFKNMPTARELELYDSLYPGSLRWASLGANKDNFSDKTGSADYTFADHVFIANQRGAYSSIVLGVNDNTDWYQDINTFTHLIDYLGAPATNTYGAIRDGEGYGELISGSKGILLEIGDEVWGGDSHNAHIGESSYDNYRDWAWEVTEKIKASDYYDPEKIIIVFSGRRLTASDSYGLNRTLYKGDTGQMDLIGVIQGVGDLNYSDNISDDQAELNYHISSIAEMEYVFDGMKDNQENMLLYANRVIPMYTYSLMPVTNSYHAVVGQAVNVIDYYASLLERGVGIGSIFHFDGGIWRMVEQAGSDYRKFPLYHFTSLFNQHCKGTILKTNYISSNVIKDVAGDPVDLSPVSTHAYTNDTNYTVLLVSRDFKNTHTVQLNLPDDINIRPQAKKISITGPSYNAHEATITKEDLSGSFNDSMLIEVPPYTMVLVAFYGDDQNYDMPWGNFEYVHPTSIEITCLEDTNRIEQLGGRLHLSANILPDSAFIRKANWEVIGDDMDITFLDGLIVAPSSGTGVDTFTVKASAAGEPSVYDAYEVIIDFTENNDTMSIATQPVSQISIYPNPVKENFLFITGNDAGGVLSITNLQGQVLLKKTIHQKPVNIDVSNLQNGIYILQINNIKGITTRKFIIDR